jgi:hypothetical protein
MKRTHEEEQALKAIREASEAMDTPSLSLASCCDYCQPEMHWQLFSESVKGLVRMGLVQMEVISKTPRLYLTTKGKEEKL